MRHPDLADGLLDGGAEEVVAFGGDVRLVVAEPPFVHAELAVPLRALGGLDAVLALDLHQDALVRERVEGGRRLLAERAGVGVQVGDQQVGQRRHIGPDAGVHARVARQLADEEDERRQVAAERSLVGAVVQLGDPREDLVQEDARRDEIRRDGVEQVARRDDGAQRPLGDLHERVVEDAELRTQLAVDALAGFRGAEAGFPEPAAGAEERVVGLASRAVAGLRGEAGVAQVAGDFAFPVGEHPFDLRAGARLLAEQDFTGHLLHIGVGQLDMGAEPVAEFLERRRRGERRLAGGDEDHPAVELGLEGLGHLGEHRGAFVGVADVLLGLVEHQRGQGQGFVLAAEAEGLPGRVHELLGGEVSGTRRELGSDRRARLLGARGEVGFRLRERLRDAGAHMEVVQFLRPGLAARLDAGPNLLEEALFVEPETEPRLRDPGGEAAGFQEDRERGDADLFVSAEQGSRGGEERLPGAAGAGVEFGEVRLDVLRKAAGDEAPGLRAVVERRVHPQVGEHLQQVRFAAAEEAADPGGVLPVAAEVGEEPVEDALQAVGEPAVADEGLQFGAEGAFAGLVRGVADPRLPLVGERRVARVPLEEFVDLRCLGGHGQPSSCRVMACAR